MEILKLAGGVAVLVIVIWIPVDADRELECNGSDFECEGPYNFITCVYLPNGQKLYVPNRCQSETVCNPKNSPAEPCDNQTAPGTTISTAPTSTADRATTLREASTLPYVRPTNLPNNASEPSDLDNSTNLKGLNELERSGFLHFKFGFNLTGFNTFSNETSGNVRTVSEKQPFVIKATANVKLNDITSGDVTPFNAKTQDSYSAKTDAQSNDIKTVANSSQFSVNTFTQGFLRFSEIQPKSFHASTNFEISNAASGVTNNMTTDLNASEIKTGDMVISAYGTVSLGNFLRKISIEPTINSRKVLVNMPEHIYKVIDANETIAETTTGTVSLDNDVLIESGTEAVTHDIVETTQTSSRDQLIPFEISVVKNIEMTTLEPNQFTDLPMSSSSTLDINDTLNPTSINFVGITKDERSGGTDVHESNLMKHTQIGTSSEANYSQIFSNDFMPSMLANEITTPMPNNQFTITEQSTDTTIEPYIVSFTEALPNTFVDNQTSSEILGTQIEASLKAEPNTSLTVSNTVAVNRDNDTKSFQIEEKVDISKNSSIIPVLHEPVNMVSTEVTSKVYVEDLRGQTYYSSSIQPVVTTELNETAVDDPINSVTSYPSFSLKNKAEQNVTIDESLVTYQSGTISYQVESTTTNSTNDIAITIELQPTTESIVENSSQNSNKTFLQENLREVTNNTLNIFGIENGTVASLNITQYSDTTIKTSHIEQFKLQSATSAEFILLTEVNSGNLTTSDFFQHNQSGNQSSPLPTEIVFPNVTDAPPATSSTTDGPYDTWDITSPSTQVFKPTQQSAEILKTQNVMSVEVMNTDFISAEITSKPTTQTTFTTPMETVTDSTTEFTTTIELNNWTQSSTNKDRGARALGYRTPVGDIEQATESYIERTTFTANDPIRYNLTDTAQDEVGNFNIGQQIEKDINAGNSTNETSMFTLEVIANLGDSESVHKSVAMQGIKPNNEAILKGSQGFTASHNWQNQVNPHLIEPETTFYQPNNTIQTYGPNSSSSNHTLEVPNNDTEPRKRELQQVEPAVIIHEAPIHQLENTTSLNWTLPSAINDVKTTSSIMNVTQRDETAVHTSGLENIIPLPAVNSEVPYFSEVTNKEMAYVTDLGNNKNLTSPSGDVNYNSTKEFNDRSKVQISEILFKSNLLEINSTSEPSISIIAENMANNTVTTQSKTTVSLVLPQESTSLIRLNSTNEPNNVSNAINNSVNVSNEQIALAKTADTNQVDADPILICQKHGVFADINNCQQYYLCVQQQLGFVKILGTCPPRTAFSRAAQRCVKDVSKCYEEKCTIEGNFTDPLDNTSYFSCIEIEPGVFVKYHQQCAFPFKFSTTERRCDLVSNFTNQISSPLTITLGEIEQTTMPNPTSYSTHNLIEPEYREMPATTNTYETAFIESFPIKDSQTVSQISNTESAIRSVRSTNSFECLQDGVFPSRENCKDYYMCVKKADGSFTQIRRQCPAHYAFHSRSKSCSRDMSVCSDLWCYSVGNFPDPKDETSYYRCVPNARGGFRIYHIKCVETNIYNPIKNLCFENTTSTTTPLSTLVTEKVNARFNTTFKETLIDEPVSTKTTTEASYEILNQTSNISSKYPVVSEGYRVQAEEKLRGILQDMRDEAVRQHEAEMLLVRKSRENDSGSESDASSSGVSEESRPYICAEEGRFPDKNNCRQYFICSKRRAGKMDLHHLTCRGSDRFDAEKRICVDEEDALCLN